jgi:acyl-CoA reductase-like NAD-dependent aldehyde dehydrogenase
MDAARGSEHRRGFFIRVPLGVVCAITPFNFPLNLVVHKVAPALAAGNSVVLKPATKTPLTALKLAETLLEAGLPPKALNVAVGAGSTVGSALVRDERIQMVTFTGSARVGEAIRRDSGLKRVALELGSNSGAIVDETANLDAALARCLAGAFAYSGQVCIHTQRLYLHQSIAETFTARLVAGAEKLVCGDPADAATDVGPMIDRPSLQRGLALVEEARAAGAEVLCGGTADRTIMFPTVISNARPEMPVVCEEAFAPVVTIETFRTFDEAVAMFNAGSSLGTYEYGLACGVFTRDVARAFRAAEELSVGNVYVNDSATFRADHQPYGGVRDSGTGREGPRFAVEEMTDIRFVSFNLDA